MTSMISSSLTQSTSLFCLSSGKMVTIFPSDPKELRQRNHDLEARIAYLMKLLEDSNKQIAQLEKEKAEKKPAEPFLLLQDLSEQLEATEKEKLIFAEHLKDTQADLVLPYLLAPLSSHANLNCCRLAIKLNVPRRPRSSERRSRNSSL